MIQNKKGFTLIELIIVMAIIGILAVVAVIAIGSKSADARDARRLADMSTVRTGMALHCAEPIDASGSTASDTLIFENAATTTLIVVSAVTGASTVSTYLDFASINDPTGTAACAVSATAACNYAFGAADAGDAFLATEDIDACDYWINFYQEGTGADGYITEKSFTE